MATQHEISGDLLKKAHHALGSVNPKKITEVNVANLQGEMTITIIYQPGRNEKKKKTETGKWAKIADMLSEKDLLRDGLGEKVRQNVREFRENFVM